MSLVLSIFYFIFKLYSLYSSSSIFNDCLKITFNNFQIYKTCLNEVNNTPLCLSKMHLLVTLLFLFFHLFIILSKSCQKLRFRDSTKKATAL